MMNKRTLQIGNDKRYEKQGIANGYTMELAGYCLKNLRLIRNTKRCLTKIQIAYEIEKKYVQGLWSVITISI
jgi:hypothetical protein